MSKKESQRVQNAVLGSGEEQGTNLEVGDQLFHGLELNWLD